MAYAGKVSDLPPGERFDLNRLKALIDQTTRNMPHIQEILNGLVYRIEQLESRVDDPAGLKAFFNGYDNDSPSEEREEAPA